jgi:tetratricopeptide (TPR) repeat protein
MLRKVAVVLIAVAAAFLLDRLVIRRWHCNVIAGQVGQATDRALLQRDTADARATALRNIELLRECVTRCPTDAGLLSLAASNYRLLSRHAVAASLLQGALRHERRPEIHFELAEAELATGLREKALEHYIHAGKFADPQLLAEIADPDIRWRAYAAVGRHREDILARQGRLDTRNRLATATWRPHQGATVTRTDGVLRVSASRADGGIRAEWGDSDVVPRAVTSAWVFVERGRVYLGSGNGNEPIRNASSTTTGRWEKLEAVNLTCPVTMTLLGAYGPEGAEFRVREVRSRITVAAPPCGS